MAFNKLTSSWSVICKWNNTSTLYTSTIGCDREIPDNSSNILLNDWTVTSSYSSIFNATPKIVLWILPIFTSNYSSEINYTIWWNNISYPSYIKTLEWTRNPHIKVAWITNNWVDIYSWTNINILNTKIDKAILKKEILKNAYSLFEHWVNNQTDYKTTNYTIDTWPVWKDIIIVEWADLIINWDLLRTDPKKLNSIVVISKWWVGWNIWITKNSNFISAIIYADKNIISWDWTNYYVNDSDKLNQLFLKWSIMSLNTIGWASYSPLKCPSNISSNCTEELANRYDLNHFRHFIEWIWWQWTAFVSWTYWTDKIDMSKPEYKGASMIIEYEPLIQNNPPFVFRINK